MGDTQLDTAVVGELPGCDIHIRLYGTQAPAEYDAATKLPGSPWAFMCAACWPRFGTGLLGLGHGQRLVLAEHLRALPGR